MSATTLLKLTFRVVLVTVLFGILGFAIGGFLGIISVVIMRAAQLPIGMQGALWFGAVPGGVLGCLGGLVVITISEKRAQRAAM